jgi:hypothetical protein
MPTSIFHPTDVTGARITIDEAHHEIHAGAHYSASHAVSVGTGTAVTVLITTPATDDIHLVFSVAATNSGTWTFSEDPNASAGTAVVSYNNDRGSANTSDVTITHTPTYSSSGTVLQNFCIGTAGQGNSHGGGAGEARNEWILKASTLYLIRFVALNAATNVAMNLSYYIEE